MSHETKIKVTNPRGEEESCAKSSGEFLRGNNQLHFFYQLPVGFGRHRFIKKRVDKIVHPLCSPNGCLVLFKESLRLCDHTSHRITLPSAEIVYRYRRVK